MKKQNEDNHSAEREVDQMKLDNKTEQKKPPVPE